MTEENQQATEVKKEEGCCKTEEKKEGCCKTEEKKEDAGSCSTGSCGS